VRAYLKQQAEYGKAEALLERKWPTKYNRGGHLAWAGRIYSAAPQVVRRRRRIGYGTWGSNLFQSVYDRTPSTLVSLPLMPEWYLLLGVLGLLAVAGSFQRPLLPWTDGAPVRAELLLFAAAGVTLVAKAALAAWRAPRGTAPGGLAVRSVTAMLFLLQPLARLAGRLRFGLTPWRRRGELAFVVPWPRRRQVWSERWRSLNDRLLELEGDLRGRCMTVLRGGMFDRWDIHVRLGPLAAARVRVAVEEHGNGRQLVRYRIWPRWSRILPPFVGLIALWFVGSLRQDVYLAIAIGAALLFVVARALREAGAGVAVVLHALERGTQAEEVRRELLDDLGPVAHTEGQAERWGGPAAAEPAEAVEQRA